MQWRIGGLALLAVLSLLFFMQVNQPETEDEPTRILPDLVLDDVTDMIIESDDSKVTLTKSSDGWKVMEKSDYPADFEALSTLLINLSEMVIAETKTARPENHARLNVADDGEGAGTRLRLQPGGEQLIIGQSAQTRGSFFRYANDPQVYLSNEPIELETGAEEWVDPIIINVDSQAVLGVSIARHGEEPLSANRDKGTETLALDDVPEGRELQYASVADSLARLLANLRLLDVEPYREDLFTRPTVTTFKVQSNGEGEETEEIRVLTIQSEGEYWLHLATPDLSPWQYRISQFTFDEMNKAVEDLLKPLDEEE